jgi:hypothetical protein
MRTALMLPLALALALPAGASAQPSEAQSGGPASRAAPPAARPFGTNTARPRMPRTVPEPITITPPPAPPRPVGDAAPVPNRDIEAPRDRFASSGTTLEPMLLPPERRPGVTFGREHLRETGPDRPFDMIVPGARLRIPFDGNR